MIELDRATFLATTLLAPLRVADPFAAIERARGGTLGAVAIDTATGRRVAHRGGTPFPLASTWKLPLVMSVLARVDSGRERLDRAIVFGKGDLEPPYSEIARRYPKGGELSVGAICAFTISDSDNTGADLLAPLAGGPLGVTAYLRSIGIDGVRVDRLERELTSRATLSQAHDVGTPGAMASLVALLVTNSPLSPASTSRLLGWMRATTTGDARLRAGVPHGWHVADKTGSYENASNDVGLLYPRSGRPIAIACYTIDVPGKGGSAAIADAAGAAVRALRGTGARG